jgi:hypothetical protein
MLESGTTSTNAATGTHADDVSSSRVLVARRAAAAFALAAAAAALATAASAVTCCVCAGGGEGRCERCGGCVSRTLTLFSTLPTGSIGSDGQSARSGGRDSCCFGCSWYVCVCDVACIVSRCSFTHTCDRNVAATGQSKFLWPTQARAVSVGAGEVS